MSVSSSSSGSTEHDYAGEVSRVNNGQTVYISYARRDEDWAKWIGWQLRKAGFDVELDKWSWQPGDNFIFRMNEALTKAELIVGVFSPAYFDQSRYTANELTASQVLTKNSNKRFIPVLVAEVNIPPLYASLIYVRLIGLREREAMDALFEGFGLSVGTHVDGATKNITEQRGPVPQFPGLTSLQSRPSRSEIILPRNIDTQIKAEVSESLGLLKDLSKTNVEPLYIEQAVADVGNLARSYNWTPPEEILSKGSALKRRILTELRRNRNPSQLRDLYLVAGQIHGVLSYAVLDLGNSEASAAIARAALYCAERAGQNELMAWVRGTQALIARYDHKDFAALEFINRGLEYNVQGSALARLYSNAALSYAALGNVIETKSQLQLSESVIDSDPSIKSTPDGIFYFPRAKLHYYAGSALLELRDASLAYEAEEETSQAIELFRTGSADERSYSDELLAYIHLSWERLRSEQIEGILPALDPLFAASPEYRTAWHRWWLERLVAILNRGAYKGSSATQQVTDKVASFIQEVEEYQANLDDLAAEGNRDRSER